jgi:hypothetical protein
MHVARKTALAVAASTALVLGSGLFAAAAVFHLPLFGLHESTAARTASTTTTPRPAPPKGTVRPADGPSVTTSTAPRDEPIGGTGWAAALTRQVTGPAPATNPGPGHATPAPAPPPTAAPSRPAAPAGCQEPEWDPDLQSWHCKGM